MPALRFLTERLLVDSLREDDAPDLHWYRSHPDVARYQSWVPVSVEETAAFIRSCHSVAFDTPGTWYQLALRLRDAESLVGDLGVHFVAESRYQAEIGFTIAPPFQRRGYAGEAVSVLLDHLFGTLGKHRVFASTDPRNLPSIGLLEKLGFRKEAHFRQSLWLKGEWVDDLIFALLRSEWRGG